MPDPIAHYHDLLAAGATAADTQADLDRMQRAGGLTFGDRPACTVLRPRFLARDQFRFVARQSGVLAGAFRAAHDRAVADPAFRAQFRLHDWEEGLLGIDPGFPDPSPTGRLDAFFDGRQSLRFTEFNAETPAGAGYADALAEVFQALPVFARFGRDFHTHPVPCRPGVWQALSAAYRAWAGPNPAAPRVAILDWREVPTVGEFEIFDRYFRSLGVESRILDPRDCTFAGGKLTCGDYHITLIYKRVLISELVERCGLDGPVVRAARAGAVCLVNPFRCKILFKKASLAVVGDERNAGLLTADQSAAVAAHVPWTRVVEDRRTAFGGGEIDLVPFVLANRDRLVLKPNDEYGGRGIVLGWAASQSVWEQAVTAALAEPFVVQERIGLPTEAFPTAAGGNLVVADRMVDTNPYVSNGGVSGVLTRISTDELVNVTAGGGSTVPTFVVEPR